MVEQLKNILKRLTWKECYKKTKWKSEKERKKYKEWIKNFIKKDEK